MCRRVRNGNHLIGRLGYNFAILDNDSAKRTSANGNIFPGKLYRTGKK